MASDLAFALSPSCPVPQVSNALLEKTGAASGGAQGVANPTLQQAFEQGAEYAAQAIAQQQAEQHAASRQEQLDAMQNANEQHERVLRERIEELQRREYRAPIKPLACKEEREAALACYRGARGGKPGEIVTQCQQVTDELDKCAALVRDAAMSKIIAGSMQS